MTLYSLQRDLNTFDLWEEVKKIIVDTSEEIAELNRGQLFQGKKSDGTKIVPEYHPITIEYKSQKQGIAGVSDRVTLHDQGDFWRLIGVENVTNDTYDLTSADWKTAKLEKKYLKTILGLSKESRAEYIENVFFPALRKVIETKTKMGFN